MKPKISIITLGVSDLETSLAFYRSLGFPTQRKEGGNIAFFELEGTWLAIYPKEELAKETPLETNFQDTPSFTLAHNVASEKEVDDVINFVREKGATIIKEPTKVFWGGYSGYFQDPDGYLWEVAYNPFTDLT